MKPIYLIAVLPLLGGCAGTIGSIAGGECQLPGVHTPQYVVHGKTTYDQEWVEGVTEGLVRGCNQPRPKNRPVKGEPKHHWFNRKPATPVVSAPAKHDSVSLPSPQPAALTTNDKLRAEIKRLNNQLRRYRGAQPKE